MLLERTVESLLAFWVDAGVDAMLEAEPVDRTAAAASAPPASVADPATEAPPRARATAPAAVPAMATASATPQAVDSARAAAGRAADLAALEAEIAAFEDCPLRGGAKRSVFARGRPDAPVMIIGEGPGAEEDQQGKPFVGRAGQLLDRMLTAAGLTDRVFITNSVFWRPPGNRTPTADEQAICEPFVQRAIELVGPKVLLLVGAASARFLLRRSEGILQLRGRWFEWRSEELEIPALATLHPAFLLRQPAAKKQAWEDLLLLRERLDRPHRPQ